MDIAIAIYNQVCPIKDMFSYNAIHYHYNLHILELAIAFQLHDASAILHSHIIHGYHVMLADDSKWVDVASYLLKAHLVAFCICFLASFYLFQSVRAIRKLSSTVHIPSKLVQSIKQHCMSKTHHSAKRSFIINQLSINNIRWDVYCGVY